MKKYLLVSVLIVTMGCSGGDDEGPDFGNLFVGTDGLILTEEEHPGGWGRSNCFACHPIADIHQVDRTGVGLPLEDIQKFVEEERLDSCAICHGDNGIFE